MIEHELDDNIPLIVAGDLNSVPNGSSMHMIMGHDYNHDRDISLDKNEKKL